MQSFLKHGVFLTACFNRVLRFNYFKILTYVKIGSVFKKLSSAKIQAYYVDFYKTSQKHIMQRFKIAKKSTQPQTGSRCKCSKKAQQLFYKTCFNKLFIHTALRYTARLRSQHSGTSKLKTGSRVILHLLQNCTERSFQSLSPSKQGLTLVELAIFLLIAALILTLATTAEKLSTSAKLKGVYSEISNFSQATDNFYAKYNFLPGDFPFSDKYFGTYCDATNATYCNGDGNNLVNLISGSETSNNYSEPLLFWRHLGLSGFLNGNYYGQVQGTVGGKDCSNDFECCFSEGNTKSCPASSITAGIYSFISWNAGSGNADNCGSSPDTGEFPKNLNVFSLGKFRSDDKPYNGLVTTKFAYALDSKFDDGLPSKGLIQTRSGHDTTTAGLGNCILDGASSASNNAAYNQDYDYDFTLEAAECVLNFIYANNSLCPLP